jgi:hypothetical protein
MRQTRTSVLFTAAQEALLNMEHYDSGASIASIIRAAVARYYADHAKRAGYQDEVRAIRRRRGEELGE